MPLSVVLIRSWLLTQNVCWEGLGEGEGRLFHKELKGPLVWIQEGQQYVERAGKGPRCTWEEGLQGKRSLFVFLDLLATLRNVLWKMPGC